MSISSWKSVTDKPQYERDDRQRSRTIEGLNKEAYRNNQRPYGRLDNTRDNKFDINSRNDRSKIIDGYKSKYMKTDTQPYSVFVGGLPYSVSCYLLLIYSSSFKTVQKSRLLTILFR